MSKKQKHFKRKYGHFINPEMDPYWHQYDLRRFSDLDDEKLEYLLAYVKGVNMLDLNEADITDTGISLLPRLEYIHELRLKGCHEVTNDCIPYINKIKGLRFLHVNHTKITIDGLLKLDQQPELETLLFNDFKPDELKEKMLQMRKLFPLCELVVNSTTYDFPDF